MMKTKKKKSHLYLLSLRSIRLWFIIPSLIQLAITAILIVFFLFQVRGFDSHALLDSVQQGAVQQIENQIVHHLQSAMQLNQMNYDSLRSGILNLASDSERERYFSAHIQAYPDVAMTFVGLSDGSFYGARRTTSNTIEVVRNNQQTKGASWYYSISKEGEGIAVSEIFPNFDPRVRPWYQKAAAIRTPAFSSVYRHFVFRKPTVTAVHPMYDENQELIGVFGVDYVLTWLEKMFDSLSLGPAGYVFIVDQDGYLLASSDHAATQQMVDGQLELLLAQESQNPLIQEILKHSADSKQPKIPLLYQQNKYFIQRSLLSQYGINWTVYVLSAEADFQDNARFVSFQTLFILTISIIATSILAFWITNHVARPIATLSNAAEALTKGHFAPIQDDGRLDELGKLNRSFNKMGYQLTNVVSNLEEEVAIRTKELKYRNEELKKLSFSDGLTGIANRRLFNDSVASAWEEALVQQRSIALYMIDIDYFKRYNDTYGHQAGDDCLRAIADVLTQKARRSSDLAARYGGEEFTVLMKEVNPQNVFSFAQTIRQAVEDLNIEHKTSPFEHVTISLGIACIVPVAGQSVDMLIEMADHALYRAKHSGRNKVSN